MQTAYNDRSAQCFLHGDKSKYIGNRTYQDNDDTNWCQVLHEDFVHMSSAEFGRLHDLIGDSLEADNADNEDTGCQGSQRHHDRVCQEVEEVQDGHAEDCHEA